MRRSVAVVSVLVCLGLLLVAATWLSTDDEPGTAVQAPATTSSPPAGQVEPPANLEDGELWLSDMDLSGTRVVTPDATLEDVRMTAHDVLIGADGLRAGTLEVDAVVPFDVVARQVGSDVTLTAAGDQARITRRIEVLGQDVRVAATGTVEADRGQVLVEPTSINIGAPGWVERRMGDVARELVTIRHDVEGLPDALVLRHVSVVESGFAVHLSGDDVDLGG